MHVIHWAILTVLVIIGSLVARRVVLFLFPKLKNKKEYIADTLVVLIITLGFMIRGIWSCYLVYVLLFSLIIRIILLFYKKNSIYLRGLFYFVFIGSFAFVFYGVINSTIPWITEYTVPIENLKDSSTIGFVSDIHLGTSKVEMIDKLVEKVNSLNVDAFVIGGDLIDEFTPKSIIPYYINKISEIKTKYGIYYIEGNHDLLTDEVAEYLENAGITILDDESVLINNNYYFVGRRDTKDKKRESLSSLTSNLEEYPIIVLDHRPNTDELKDSKVSLQLSGHTHGGQIWPLNYFLKHGEDKTNHLIVSYGYGTWYAPVRTSGHSEIEVLHLEKK